MHQIYPDDALVPLLERIVNGDIHIHLTESSTPFDRSTTLATLAASEVAAVTGYAPITVAAADFSLSGVSAHLGTLTALPVVFTASAGSASVYGYYVTDTGNADLLWCANFDGAPITYDSSNPVQVTPVVYDVSKLAS